MTEKNNPMMCDPASGICELPVRNSESVQSIRPAAGENLIKLIYFTDPICSSCWGIEPQLRKLKLEYGHALEWEYRMGGLLPDWSYNSGGISKPSDVANHWDEVSAHYDMPIDGDVWLKDPLDSSYPPSIAFKAAQMQDRKKAILFLREIREMVFLKKTNIAKWEPIATAAKKVGLDVQQLKTDMEGKAIKLFEEDLNMAKEQGVRGFPTMLFVDEDGNTELAYGSKPYAFYEVAILKLNGDIKKKEYSKNWESIFIEYPTLTAKEYSELSAMPRAESENFLRELTSQGKLGIFSTKNGSIWTRTREI